MQYFFSEINRTDSTIRANLNSKLRDKRLIFEEMIIRSVRELLNSNNTTLKLEDKQNILNQLTSTRRRRDKERFANAANALQHSTANAPMGFGNAASVALTAATTANDLLYERSEQQILERAAQESLDAAKFNIYTPQSDNYTMIAKTVARELSFSLQPLLLVLAAGENGIVKLAEFTEKSRRKYAVEKLPEYHSTNSVSEIANALIDASIPPISDASFYRDFFKVDIYNFDIQLGKHTTLSFDPEVRELLKLAGLDTEIFFGRLDVSQYTIIGALNHSVFLGQNYQLYAGIETPNRIKELITGTLKYPLRLIAPGRNIGATGVSFAPRPTGIYLEEAQIEVLKKLFPNFSDPNAIIVSAEELAQDKVILPDYSTRKYRSERNSVPWSLTRTAHLQRRIETVLSARINHGSPEDMFCIPNHDKLKTIRDAGDNFDISYSKKDLLDGSAKTREIQIQSFGAFDTLNKIKLLLTAAKYSKYLAITTSQYVYCLIKSETSTCTDLIFATKMLDASRTALNLSRNYPLIEVQQIQNAKNICRKSLMQADQDAISQMQLYKVLLLLAEKFHDTIEYHDFLIIIPRLIAWKKKSLIGKHSMVREELININDFINALTNYSFMAEDREELTETQAILRFKDTANQVIERLYSVNNQDDINDILKKIEICALEIKIINYEITTILENPELKPENFNEIKLAIDQAFQITNTLLNENQEQVSRVRWLDINRLLIQLREALSAAKQQRDTCETFLTNLKLNFTGSPDDTETEIFLSRIQAYNQYGRLLFITNSQTNDQILTELLMLLETSISTIYRGNERTIKAQLTDYQLDIKQYLTINSSASVEELFTATHRLKDAKQKMELSFANDAEILSRIHKQAQYAVRDQQTLIQDFFTFKDGIANILIDCNQKLRDPDFRLEQSAINKILKLKSLLTSQEESDASSEPEIFNFLEIIEQIIKIFDDFETVTSRREVLNTAIIKQLDELVRIHSCNFSDDSFIIKDLSRNQSSPISVESKHEEPYASDLWAISVIVYIFNFAIEQILAHPDDLSSKLKTAEQNLVAIQNEIDAEPRELIKTRTITIGKIKQSYQYITHAQKEKSKLIDSIPSHSISANTLIAGNLAWAVRPNFNELKYLDQKIEGLRKERFEKQQKHKNETIIINPLIIYYLQVGVDILKKQQEALNKLKTKIKSEQDKIFGLTSPTEKQKTDPTLKKLNDKFKKLKQISEVKYRFIVEKTHLLENCKSDFTKHILKAYFEYLKLEVDILESETQQPSSYTEKSLKEAPPNIQTSIQQKKVSITELEGDILKAAKKYSISDLEKHYIELSTILKQYLTAKEQRNSSTTDSNSEQEEVILTYKASRLQTPKAFKFLNEFGVSPEIADSSPGAGRTERLITEISTTRKSV